MSSPIVVRALEAGEAINMLVAERVMGWTNVHPAFDGDGSHWFVPTGVNPATSKREQVPAFSWSIAAAFLVVEQMNNRCCDLTIQKAGGAWYVDFIVGDGQGETLPLAICRAALDALNRTTNLFGEVVPAGRCAP